jgi:hypothetical protein
MVDRSRPRRSPARYLAPLALAAMFAGTYVIVHHGLHSGSTHQSGTTIPPASRHRAHKHTVRHRTSPKFYVVRSGDSLSVIAERTGLSIVTLQGLNPSLNPNSLQVGQRLRLRR